MIKPARNAWLAPARNAWLASLLWLGLGLLILIPGPLAWMARLFREFCAHFPVLAMLGRVVPPRPLLVLLLLGGTVVAVSIAAGTRELIGALRLARELRRLAAPAPPAVKAASRRLGLEQRLTYVAIET